MNDQTGSNRGPKRHNTDKDNPALLPSKPRQRLTSPEKEKEERLMKASRYVALDSPPDPNRQFVACFPTEKTYQRVRFSRDPLS